MTAIDPITLEVIGSAFQSIAEEMGTVLIKSSYSSNIKERRDCSTAIFDVTGNTVAQAEHIPIHLGSMLGIIEVILRKFPLESIRPGDMFMTNDPYVGGGTHLPDITIAAPVFRDGKIVAFVANIAHHAEAMGRGARSIYEEGLRIPPVRIYDDGRLCQDVLDFLLTNYRLVDERMGDLRAQFAANTVGIRRSGEVLEKYGTATTLDAMAALQDYAERKFRAGAAGIPDGEYSFTDYLDNDGYDRENVKLQVKITIRGDQVHLDFAGTETQVTGPFNVVRTALLATVYYALKAVVDPTIPANGGFYRAIEVDAPLGSILNCASPAPVQGRTETCQRVVDLVFGALAQVIPQRITAAHNGSNTSATFSGVSPRNNRYYAYLETLGGGFGARPDRDGLDGVQVHITNTSNLPVECLEVEYPLMVTRYELVCDSGGAGEWRGGMAIRRDYRPLGHAVTFSGNGERHHSAPWGLFGGGEGGRGRFVYRVPGGRTRRLPKIARFDLAPESTLTVQTPGSGGYGEPKRRDPERVRADRRDGKISRAAMEKVYKQPK